MNFFAPDWPLGHRDDQPSAPYGVRTNWSVNTVNGIRIQ